MFCGVAKGPATRQRILDEALRRTSTSGLRGTTIGELAAAAGMSKSGLFAHFGSREALELAIVEEMTRRFVDFTWQPVAAERDPRRRLEVIFDRWLAWVDGYHLPGGCPIIASMAELDDRPGPARDHLAAAQSAWLEALEGALHDAGGRSGGQFGFELQGILMTYSAASRLLGDANARERAERAHGALVDRYLGQSTASPRLCPGTSSRARR